MLGAAWGKIFVLSRSRVRLAGLLVLACASLTAGAVFASERHVAPHQLTGDARRPNIVFVLTDDLSMNLLRFMPYVQAMMRQGMSFNNYFVSDSLCCPSRASIFTGNFPHTTGIFGNAGKHGGFNVFHARGEEQNTFAVALRRVGYRTALMGKYLNGYMQRGGVPETYVPPGWNEWDAVGWGYSGFDYVLNQNGSLYAYGNQPNDYLTDVIARRGLNFIDSAAAANNPFFLELSTFAPHRPSVPAPRDAHLYPDLTAPRPGNFDVLPTNAPMWLAGHAPLTPGQIAKIDDVFRRRAQSVQAVDQMIGQIQQRLNANGIAENTYIVFSSDNGFHTGQYRLMPGKLTAFDTDIRVPLVVVGPGVPPASTSSAMTENVDLAGTFAAIGGARFAGDGHSLLPLLQGQPAAEWRNAVLIEHHGRDLRGVDPDFQQPASGNPSTYEAMRTRDFLYVEYIDGETEFYDLTRDRLELHNLAPRLTLGQLVRLHQELSALKQCHGATECWEAMRIEAPVVSIRRRHR